MKGCRGSMFVGPNLKVYVDGELKGEYQYAVIRIIVSEGKTLIAIAEPPPSKGLVLFIPRDGKEIVIECTHALEDWTVVADRVEVSDERV